MIVFTVLAEGKGPTRSSLLITHPSNLAGNSLLACGAATAQPFSLPISDETAFHAQEAMAIPLADHVHYVTVRPEHGHVVSLFQACYRCEESTQAQPSLLLPLLARTRSLVLFAPPDAAIAASFLQPLVGLLKEANTPANQFGCTIVVPSESPGTINQDRCLHDLLRRPISADHFALAFGDAQKAAQAYYDCCPDLVGQVKDEFQSVSWLACSSGDTPNSSAVGSLETFRTESWEKYIRLAPRALVAAARGRAHDMLLGAQSSYARQMLVLSTLQQVALAGDDAADRIAVINLWNQVDRVVGNDWLIPLLRDGDAGVRHATVAALGHRLPNAMDTLLEMALLDYASDVYESAQEVVVRARNGELIKKLIASLDDPLFPKRQGARKMLMKLGMASLPMLRARMREGSYAGRVGAAAVLASFGNRRSREFLRTEFRRSRFSSHRRGLVEEAINSWSPAEWNALTMLEKPASLAKRPSASTSHLGLGQITASLGKVLNPSGRERRRTEFSAE